MSTRNDPVETDLPSWQQFKQINWKSIFFSVFLLPCMGLVYWTVNAQGLRMTVPAFGTKLCKVPGLAILGLGHWRIFHEIDVAPFFAIVILVFVFLSTTSTLRILIYGVPKNFANPIVQTRVIFAGAAALVLFDAMVFYRGLLDQAFFEQGIRFVPLLMTVGYSVALIYAAYLHVVYEHGDQP